MKVIENYTVIFFDTDGTLIKEGVGDKIIPIEENVELLKEHKKAGEYVVVWSHASFAHAVDVVKALKLESYVDLVISKPKIVYDDLPAEEILNVIEEVN